MAAAPEDDFSSWVLVERNGSRPRPIKQCILHPTKRHDITQRNINKLFKTQKYKDLLASRLSGAVKIPCITYDGMGIVGKDDRWDVFYDMGNYLEDTFSALHSTQCHFRFEIVNEHAYLYTWKGSDLSLKPLLFMAHTDVVPAPDLTLGRWTHPPFSGLYDGNYVWGRGAEDDKSNLIAISSAMTELHQAGFEPSRTVILAVGFDEEGGAKEGQGARCLAEMLLQRYGEDGIELIFDEGIAGIEEHFGTEFALPATAEKGYLDVSITLDTVGGHSSTPPDHTAIGYLAQIIQMIEEKPFSSCLTPENPTLAYLETAAAYAKNMPSELRDAILNSPSEAKLIEYMDSSLETRALVRTSTAVDIVCGGEKANALPETVVALVNHRIAIEDSVRTVKDHYLHILSPLAKKWNFGIKGFGSETRGNNIGTFTLTSNDDLEPSPVSDPGDARFEWLTGTLRGVFGEQVVVAPVLLTGNTDTKYYWKLSSQIYRFSPWRANLDPRGTNMHTVDERMPVEGLLEMVKFYHEFIRIVDEQCL